MPYLNRVLFGVCAALMMGSMLVGCSTSQSGSTATGQQGSAPSGGSEKYSAEQFRGTLGRPGDILTVVKEYENVEATMFYSDPAVEAQAKQFVKANDLTGLQRLMQNGYISLVETGTQVRIIGHLEDHGVYFYQARVLSGRYRDQLLYVFVGNVE